MIPPGGSIVRLRAEKRRCGRRDSGSFSSAFLTFSLLLLVMALGFVFGRVVIARAYVKTAAGLKKTGGGTVPGGQALAASGVAGSVGALQSGQATPPDQGAQPEGAQETPAPAEQTAPAPSGETSGAAGSDAADQPDTSAPTGEGRYAIQIGAFGSEESARKAMSRLTNAGYPARIEVDRQRNTFKVLTGRYRTEENAQQALGELKHEGFSEAFVAAR